MTILISNPKYDILSEKEKAKICNGAGAANDWRSVLISNTILGLDCTEAFNIHDYDYHVGLTISDKVRADANMLANVIRIVNAKGGGC